MPGTPRQGTACQMSAREKKHRSNSDKRFPLSLAEAGQRELLGELRQRQGRRLRRDARELRRGALRELRKERLVAAAGEGQRQRELLDIHYNMQ